MKNSIILFILFSLMSCDKLCDIPPLKTNRVLYIGNALRLDGLYYTKDYKSDFFLYRNGILKGVCVDDAINAIPNKFKCSLDADIIAGAKKVPYKRKLYR